MKKGLFRPTRRIPRLELLEDRTLLSGNVTALLDPATGILTLTGDIGNNNISLTTVNPFGVPEIRVAGVVVPPSPANGFRADFTSVNSVTFSDFTLSSVTSIIVNLQSVGGAPTGNDTVSFIGNGFTTTGTIPPPVGPVVGAPAFAIPNNIKINANGGNDTFSFTKGITANTINIDNSTGTGKNTVTFDTVKAGASTILLGTGADTVHWNNVIIGTATVTTGGGGDTFTLDNSPTQVPLPPPAPPAGFRPAIGQLTVSTGNGGDNTIKIGTAGTGATAGTPGSVTLGIVRLSEGTGGTNTVTLDNATFIQGSITTGVSTKEIIDASGDVITGSAGLVIVDGVGGAALHTITVKNDTMSGGALSVITGDGIVYYGFDSNGNKTLDPTKESSLLVSHVTGAGAATFSVGKDFANVTIGDTTANALVAGSLTLAVGDNPLAIVLNKVLTGDENNTIGNAAAAAAPAFTISAAGTVGGNETWTVGNGYGNFTDSEVVGKAQSITLGNGNGNISITGNVGTTRTIVIGNGTGTVTIGGTTGTSGASGTTGNTTITIGSGHNTGTGTTVGGTINGTLTVNISSNDNLTITAAVTKDITVVPAAGSTADNVNVTVGTGTATLTVGGSLNIGTATAPLGANATILVQSVNAANINISVGNTPNSIAVVGDAVAGNTTGNLVITAGAGSLSPNSSNIYVANYLTNFTTITTAAGGQYMVSLVNLMVQMDLEVHLGSPSGANVLWAQAVTTLFGTIDGGSPSNSVYYDPGFPLDDSGFAITGFIGFP
jgi:hypothetical protein